VPRWHTAQDIWHINTSPKTAAEATGWDADADTPNIHPLGTGKWFVGILCKERWQT